MLRVYKIGTISSLATFFLADIWFNSFVAFILAVLAIVVVLLMKQNILNEEDARV